MQVTFLSVNFNYLSFSFRPTLFSSLITWGFCLSKSFLSIALNGIYCTWASSTVSKILLLFFFFKRLFFKMTLIDVRPKSGDVLWVELTFISVCRAVLGSDPCGRLALRNEARAYKKICILTQLTQNKYVPFSSAGVNKQSPLCSVWLCCAALQETRTWLPRSCELSSWRCIAVHNLMI